MPQGANRIALEGKVIGRLTVIEPVRIRGRPIKYRCRCKCGSDVVVGGQNLRRGLTQSCGCLQRERAYEANLQHGQWHVFENFWHDMGDPPKGMTLDRKDNDLGYSKKNCQWATRRVQANNRRSSKFITFHGKTKTQAEWERALGLKPGVLWQRLNRGWSIEMALTSDLGGF